LGRNKKAAQPDLFTVRPRGQSLENATLFWYSGRLAVKLGDSG